MNIQTDDSCKEQFESMKFHKIEARYIVYQIDNERIVPLTSSLEY